MAWGERVMGAHSWVALAEDYLALRRKLGFGLHKGRSFCDLPDTLTASAIADHSQSI